MHAEAEARGRGSRRRQFRRRLQRWGLVLATTVFAAVLVLLGVARLSSNEPWMTGAVRRELQRSAAPPEEVRYYQARGFRPLWVRRDGGLAFWRGPALDSAARQLLAATPMDDEHTRLGAAIDAASSRRPADLARADVALSRELASYAQRLHTPAGGARLAFLDPALAGAASPWPPLDQAPDAPSLSQHLATLAAVNPIYQALRDGLVAYRAEWSRLPQVQQTPGPRLALGDRGERVEQLRQRLGLIAGTEFDEALEQAVRRFQSAHGLAETGDADAQTIAALNAGAAHYERLIAANLERARALPPPPGRRFILVNVAAAELWLYEDGRPRGSMRVVVGQRGEPTPMMAGLIRYLVFNPYWEVPADLVRVSLAPKVLKNGADWLAATHMQALSGWSDQSSPLDPHRVDWAAVAAGRLELHVRQQPGGDNMMGRVKFMLPNALGIYLHDTPNKAAFDTAERLLSAGCVRLERADALAAWLLGPAAPNPASLGPSQRVDLDEPVPVYITYLTAAPASGGIRFYPDAYGRDPPLLASLG